MVFLFILWIILIVTIVIMTAKIEIKIENLVINSHVKEHFYDGYKVIIKLNVFGNIPIIKFTITKKRLKKLKELIKMNEKIKKIEKDILENKNQFDRQMMKEVKELGKSIYVKELDLKTELGTENAFLTSILVGIVSSILSIAFSKMYIKKDYSRYKVEPIYSNQNFIKIAISGIFQIKLIHIINIIYVLNKKGGMKNHERTSNRRSYDYSYE